MLIDGPDDSGDATSTIGNPEPATPPTVDPKPVRHVPSSTGAQDIASPHSSTAENTTPVQQNMYDTIVDVLEGMAKHHQEVKELVAGCKNVESSHRGLDGVCSLKAVLDSRPPNVSSNASMTLYLPKRSFMLLKSFHVFFHVAICGTA